MHRMQGPAAAVVGHMVLIVIQVVVTAAQVAVVAVRGLLIQLPAVLAGSAVVVAAVTANIQRRGAAVLAVAAAGVTDKLQELLELAVLALS